MRGQRARLPQVVSKAPLILRCEQPSWAAGRVATSRSFYSNQYSPIPLPSDSLNHQNCLARDSPRLGNPSKERSSSCCDAGAAVLMALLDSLNRAPARQQTKAAWAGYLAVATLRQVAPRSRWADSAVWETPVRRPVVPQIRAHLVRTAPEPNDPCSTNPCSTNKSQELRPDSCSSNLTPRGGR
jgi:hypothetical protein